MRDLTRKQRCKMGALENALAHHRELIVSDYVKAPVPVEPRRLEPLPEPGTVDPTGFAPGGIV